MGHYLTVVLAENLYAARLEGDEPEPIEVVPARISELDDWVWREDFSEARSIAALYMARDILTRNGVPPPTGLHDESGGGGRCHCRGRWPRHHGHLRRRQHMGCSEEG